MVCECLKTKVPNISVFSAAMQGGFWLRSVLNVDMISLQPTFMMFTDGLIKIKTKKNSAFTGLILKLCFTAIIYYVWRERNSRFFEGNPSSKQNVVLENCKGSKTETAFGLWAKLESLYQSKSLLNRILLKKRLYSLKMKEGAKVSEHLNTFNDILSQLESIGVKMDDEDKAVTLLCTLPDSYDNLVTT